MLHAANKKFCVSGADNCFFSSCAQLNFGYGQTFQLWTFVLNFN